MPPSRSCGVPTGILSIQSQSGFADVALQNDRSQERSAEFAFPASHRRFDSLGGRFPSGAPHNDGQRNLGQSEVTQQITSEQTGCPESPLFGATSPETGGCSATELSEAFPGHEVSESNQSERSEAFIANRVVG